MRAPVADRPIDCRRSGKRSTETCPGARGTFSREICSPARPRCTTCAANASWITTVDRVEREALAREAWDSVGRRHQRAFVKTSRRPARNPQARAVSRAAAGSESLATQAPPSGEQEALPAVMVPARSNGRRRASAGELSAGCGAQHRPRPTQPRSIRQESEAITARAVRLQRDTVWSGAPIFHCFAISMLALLLPVARFTLGCALHVGCA
jgi:hypothetical protein